MCCREVHRRRKKGGRNQNFCFSQTIWAIVLISLSLNSISSFSPRPASRRKRPLNDKISGPLITTASVCPFWFETTRCFRRTGSNLALVLVCKVQITALANQQIGKSRMCPLMVLRRNHSDNKELGVWVVRIEEAPTWFMFGYVKVSSECLIGDISK